ncbi:unnamed protein product, partial [Notodromas monacha]
MGPGEHQVHKETPGWILGCKRRLGNSLFDVVQSCHHLALVVKVQWKAPSPVRNYPVNAGGGPQHAQQGGLLAPLPPPLDVRRPPPALPVHLMSDTGLPPLTPNVPPPTHAPPPPRVPLGRVPEPQARAAEGPANPVPVVKRSRPESGSGYSFKF